MVKCSSCGKREEELGGGLLMMRCARCFEVSYCDGACQRAHWAAHKAYCKERAAAIAAVKAKPVALIGGDEGLEDAAALHRAADAGDAGAMMNLGLCYQLGKGGVGVDAAEAVRWYTRATEARNPPAAAYNNLAACYYGGDGVRKHLPEAARLFRITQRWGTPSRSTASGCAGGARVHPHKDGCLVILVPASASENLDRGTKHALPRARATRACTSRPGAFEVKI